MKRFELITQAAIPEMFLYGVFGDEINPGVFQSFMVKARPYQEIVLRIHSRGGDPDEGLSMITEILEAKKKQTIITQNDGMAASFGSVIFAMGTKRKMAKYAKLMLHQCSVTQFVGQAKELRELADEVDKVNDMMADIYAEATGKEKSWIMENWLAPGVDKWFTAEEALEAGLATEIIDGNVRKTAETNPAKLAAFFDETLFKQTNSDTMKLQAYIPQLNKVPGIKLSAEATDAEISVAMTAALGKTVELAAKVDAQKTEIETLQKSTLKDKGAALVAAQVGVKITQDEVAYHEMTACASEEGYAATKKYFEGLPVIQDPLKLAASGNKDLNAKVNAEGKKLIDLGYKELFKKHSTFLAQLRKDDPAVAAEKYEADYGVKPTWAP